MNNGVICLAVALTALLSAVSVHAGCESTDACLRAIEKAQADTQTISGEFVQVKHLNLLDEPLVSTGRFVFKRPDRMLLSIEQPQRTKLVIKGQDVQIPNLPERERRALGMAQAAAMFTQLGAIFTGSTAVLREGFEVAASEEDATIKVKLVPRQAAWKQMFQSIDIRFGGPDLLAQQIRLEDALGDSLEVTLRNMRRNIDVPESTFDVGKQ